MFAVFYFYKLYDARNECRSTDVDRSEKKSRSRDIRDILLTYFCIFWLVGLAVNRDTEFEVPIFTRSRDIEEVPKCKSRSRGQDHAPFDP